MAGDTIKFDVHRFDGKDFYLWKFQMKIFLSGQDLWQYADGTKVKPEEEGAELVAWKKADQKAMMFITQALKMTQLAHVVNCESSKEIWDRLTTIHEQKSKTSVHMLLTQFFE